VEMAEAKPEIARQVNALIPGQIARHARKLGAAMIHYSTDYVFDGTKGTPYQERDRPNPLNTYGRSKLEGEQLIQEAGGAFLILRTSWVFSMRGAGFFNKVLQWSRSQETLRVVYDQVGSPTWARALANVTRQLAASCLGNSTDYFASISGIYHAAGAGCASRFQWAQAILEDDPQESEQVVRELLPARTSDFPSSVIRPQNSSLSNEKLSLLKIDLPYWQDSVRNCLLNRES
jgi:dTDP-4-dehydrorhamnose reductase